MTLLNQQHKSINIVSIIGDLAISILTKTLQVSVFGGQIGAVLGLIVGAVLWIFFKQNTNFGMFEGAIIGMMFIGLTGLIFGGLIGLILGTVNVYHNGRLYELYIYSMVWLGASPPSEYKSLQTNVKVEVGIGRLFLKVCFWISFWAIEGAILGVISGLFFGLFGFIAGSLGEAIISMLSWSVIWGVLGAMYGIILGPIVWLTSESMKRVKYAGSFAEIPFWLVGGKIGEKIFDKLFGDDVK